MPLQLPAPTSLRTTPLSVSAEGLWSIIDPGLATVGLAPGNHDVQLVRPDGGVARVNLGFIVSELRLPPMRLADTVPIWVLGMATTGQMVTAVPIDAPDGGLALRYLATENSLLPAWANSRWIFGPPTPGRLLRMRRAP